MTDTKQYVFEVKHQRWPEFRGNQLYDTLSLAKCMGMQDYMDAFPGDEVYSWENILKGFFVLYEDGIATELTLRVRHVKSLDK